ncbi:MAG: hypothetical protein IJL48_05055 [Bacteroidales bacterium]|nr:hypothetical protein [Bacteroidales bacterium]
MGDGFTSGARKCADTPSPSRQHRQAPGIRCDGTPSPPHIDPSNIKH